MVPSRPSTTWTDHVVHTAAPVLNILTYRQVLSHTTHTFIYTNFPIFLNSLSFTPQLFYALHPHIHFADMYSFFKNKPILNTNCSLLFDSFLCLVYLTWELTLNTLSLLFHFILIIVWYSYIQFNTFILVFYSLSSKQNLAWAWVYFLSIICSTIFSLLLHIVSYCYI